MNQDILIELKTARPMSFQRRNKTLESQGLCSAINSTILDLEVRQRVRKAKDKNTFTLAVERIVADLVVSAYAVESRWAYRSLCNDKFAGELIKAVTFRKVMGLMLVAATLNRLKAAIKVIPFMSQGDYLMLSTRA